MLGEGVRETELCPSSGLPERDCARESMSCWAAVCVDELGRDRAGDGKRPVRGEDRSCRERAAV